jgi:hypothetical protein
MIVSGRAGDRIRTDYIQLGKLPLVSTEMLNKPFGCEHFTRTAAICKHASMRMALVVGFEMRGESSIATKPARKHKNPATGVRGGAQ